MIISCSDRGSDSQDNTMQMQNSREILVSLPDVTDSIAPFRKNDTISNVQGSNFGGAAHLLKEPYNIFTATEVETSSISLRNDD